MPQPYQGRRRAASGATVAQHRAQSVPGRRLLGSVSAVGIAAAAALVAQSLPASPLTRDAVAAKERAAVSAASGAVPRATQVVAASGLGVSAPTVSGVVGQVPASSLRMTAVSREQERPTLSGCAGTSAASGHANGQIPVSELCALPFATGHRLRPDAAVSLVRLDQAYAEVFGDDLCITDSYRTIGSQLSLAARKPRLAARPGTSEHGWGIAVDLCGKAYSTGTREHDWLLANARRFGWDNPAWARADGGKPEPWHWEYVAGQVTRSSDPNSG